MASTPRASSSWRTKLSRFALVNALVCVVAACAWACSRACGGFAGLWLGSCVRCALSVALISAFTRKGEPISRRAAALPLATIFSIWAKVIVYSAPGDSIVLTLAARLAPSGSSLHVPSDGIARYGWSQALAVGVRGVSFVGVSFLWELAFDFFHYWVHRACHASATLYRIVHKTHHRHQSPSPLTTYDHSPLDVLASNLLPALLAFGVLAVLRVPRLGEAERQLLFAFKSYVEVAGHSGVNSRPRSFPQCVWLPGLIPCGRSRDGYTGVAAHTCEHDWHHAVLRCNFSKRFRVWDVAFGTYESPPDRTQASESSSTLSVSTDRLREKVL